MKKPTNLPHRRPILYLISNRRAFPESSGWERQLRGIAAAARAGCSLIQIREKDLSARELARFTREALALAHPWGARVLVNDRLDVALATGADGVHLRTTSLPASVVRRTLDRMDRTSFLIGVSTHSLDEARAAAEGGADFIVCGPVHETPSKIALGPPLGLAGLGEICRSTPIPVLALGGIKRSNYREALAAGAAGIAGIGLFQDPPDPAALINDMLGHHQSLQ